MAPPEDGRRRRRTDRHGHRAVDEFLDDFTHVHSGDAAHPAIQAMDALESLLRLPAGLLDPAIADHHPLRATAEDVAAVVEHATELTSLHPAVGPRPADRSGGGGDG